MGKDGGGLLQFTGAVLSMAGFPYIGLPLMIGGGILTQQALKKEAMERMKSAMTGLRANTRTTERPIPVIYGRERVGGNVVWMSTAGGGPNDFDPPRNKLFVVYGISEGPIDGYEEMFFNDVKVWDARSGQLKTQFYNRFYSEFRTGTNSQAPFSHVATYHNLYDIASETFPLTAVALVEFFYDSDAYQSVPNVSWTVRGKQVPDWTDAASPGIVKWTQSGPLQVADLLTNKQYGMGIASANLNVSDLTSAHAYATANISPGSRETIEIVDMSFQRPKYFEKTVDIPIYPAPGYMYESGDYFPSSPAYHFSLTDKVPIKPGSLTLISILGSAYKDAPNSGFISQFGQLQADPAGTVVGSINYLTGDAWINKPPRYLSEDNAISIDIHPLKTRWYADWEFSFRAQFKSLTRSLYIVSTPETLVETGTLSGNVITLYSSQGGGGTADLSTGEVNAYFGAHEWYGNNPVEVHYRVSSRARFSTNYPLFEPEKVMDAIKNIQNHYRGFMVYANGKYGIRADKPEGSVYSFDDDNIVAGTFRMHQPSIKEIPTKVTLKYLDSLNNFTPAEASFDVRSVDPGMEIEHILDMPGVNARDEAMATAYSYANLANLSNFIEFETNHNAIGVEAGDVVDVTHPAAAWSQKLFRVLGISFAKDDKLAISAIEHDPSAYVDDWMQGPMVSRNPSFFPNRSYWPPNVSSVDLSEYSRTLSDGTVVPVIKYTIEAVDSAYLSVDHWNIYYSNVTRGQQTHLGFSGVNTVGYLSPVEPGWNNVAVYAVSQFGNESAKVWTGSVNVLGGPEYEWQNWRFDTIYKGVIVSSDANGPSDLLWTPNGRFYGFTRYGNGGFASIGKMIGARGVLEKDCLTGGSPQYHVSLAPTSGSCVMIIGPDTGNLTRAAIYTQNSLTCVKSWSSTGYGFSQVQMGANPAPGYAYTNSAGVTHYWFMAANSLGDSTRNLSRVRWQVISTNLVASAPNTPFGTIAGTPTGFSVTRTTSGILFVAALVNSGNVETLNKWVFSDNMSSVYIAGSAFYTAQSGDFDNSAFRVTVGAYSLDRAFLAMNRMAGKSGSFLGHFDASTIDAPRIFSRGEDLTLQGQAGNTLMFYTRASVNSSDVAFLHPYPIGASWALEYDSYNYYRVDSVTASNMQTWLQ